MLTLLAKLLNILNSDATPTQIALAIALAMIAGVNSLLSLLGLLAVFLVFVLRVNISAFIGLFAVFGLLSLAFAPVLSAIGEMLLTGDSLQQIFTAFYNQDWFRLFDLNNTLVFGSAVMSLLLFIPTFFLAKTLVIKYRLALMSFVNKFKVVQTLKASKFYQIYQTVKG